MNSKDIYSFADARTTKQKRLHVKENLLKRSFLGNINYESVYKNINDYAYEMTDADHVELLTLANNSPAKLLISGYDNPLYRKHLKRWHKKKIDVACHSGVCGKVDYHIR